MMQDRLRISREQAEADVRDLAGRGRALQERLRRAVTPDPASCARWFVAWNDLVEFWLAKAFEMENRFAAFDPEGRLAAKAAASDLDAYPLLSSYRGQGHSLIYRPAQSGGLGPDSRPDRVLELLSGLLTSRVEWLEAFVDRLPFYEYDTGGDGRTDRPPVVRGPAAGAAEGSPPVTLPTVFLVHGRAAVAKHEVARFIERLGANLIVLEEGPNCGRVLLEKFEESAVEASYAVILATGDDEGGLRGAAERRPRARQNVIFEAGFFFGALGRDRVAVVLESGVEFPSDIEGIAYIPLSDWKLKLARELRAAHLDLDYGRLFT